MSEDLSSPIRALRKDVAREALEAGKPGHRVNVRLAKARAATSIVDKMLDYVHRHGSRRVVVLHDVLAHQGLEHHTGVAMLSAAVQRGWLWDPVRGDRGYELRLTEKGHERARAVGPALAKARARFCRNLGEVEPR